MVLPPSPLQSHRSLDTLGLTCPSPNSHTAVREKFDLKIGAPKKGERATVTDMGGAARNGTLIIYNTVGKESQCGLVAGHRPLNHGAGDVLGVLREVPPGGGRGGADRNHCFKNNTPDSATLVQAAAPLQGGWQRDSVPMKL